MPYQTDNTPPVQTPPIQTSHELLLVLLRGLVGRCPHCGKGRLLRNYLKPVDHCSVCHEAYGHIRADDGPAWFTILLVGHILGVVLLAVVPGSSWPVWLSMLVWPGFALLLALLVLPRAKGMFIALIWRIGCIGSEKA